VYKQLTDANNQNPPSVTELARQAHVGWEYARRVVDDIVAYGQVVDPLQFDDIDECVLAVEAGAGPLQQCRSQIHSKYI
jgi:hypothetical protein